MIYKKNFGGALFIGIKKYKQKKSKISDFFKNL